MDFSPPGSETLDNEIGVSPPAFLHVREDIHGRASMLSSAAGSRRSKKLAGLVLLRRSLDYFADLCYYHFVRSRSCSWFSIKIKKSFRRFIWESSAAAPERKLLIYLRNPPYDRMLREDRAWIVSIAIRTVPTEIGSIADGIPSTIIPKQVRIVSTLINKPPQITGSGFRFFYTLRISSYTPIAAAVGAIFVQMRWTKLTSEGVATQ